MDLLDGDVELTEFEAIDVQSVKGVGQGANGFPILMMKGLAEPAVKDWAAWDAAHEGGKGGSNAGAASAQAEARQTQAQEKDGKKPDAAELHNAHEVHVAHEEHEAHLHAEHETHVGHHEHETHEEHEAAMRAERGQTHPASSASTSSLPKASAEQEAKDAQLSRKSATGRNCPKCDATFDADHKGNTCDECGAKLPPASTAKALAAVVKAVDADGTIDEGPDVDLGQQIMSLLAQAIINEAQEIKAGAYGESFDVEMLTAAANMVRMWIGRESAPDEGSPMGLLMAAAKAAQSTASQNDLPDSAFAYIEDGGSKDADGKTTPRSKRHFPVHDAAHARNALARLSSSPFGGKAKAKVHAAAKKFGIDVSDDTSKSTVAEGGTTVDTEPQGNEGLSKALEAAVTKAEQLEERVNALDAALAKVKATPIPGGPMMSVARPAAKAEDGEDWAAKAAYYRAQADAIADPGTADGYRQLARQADDKAAKALAS
jgi:hypothetical protein